MNPLLLERNPTWTIIHHPWEKKLPSFHLSRGRAAGMAPDLQAILLPYLRGPYLFLSFVDEPSRICGYYCNYRRSEVMAKCWWIVFVFVFFLLFSFTQRSKSSKGNPGGGNSNTVFFFIFHPYLGKWSNLTFTIFQMGWFNHQLEMVVFLSLRYPKNYCNSCQAVGPDDPHLWEPPGPCDEVGAHVTPFIGVQKTPVTPLNKAI